MTTLDQRLKKLEAPREFGLKTLSIIVDENTSDEEMERLKRVWRTDVFRSNENTQDEMFLG